MAEESKKGRAAKKAVAVTAAVSVLLSGLFSSPADLPAEEDLPEPPAVVELLPVPEPVEDLPEAPAADPEEEKKKVRLSLPARLAILAGIWISAAVLIALFASLLAALPAVSAAILRFAAAAFVVALAAIATLKLLFPEKSLRELLEKRNLLKIGAVCILSGLLCAVGALLLRDRSVLRCVLCPVLALLPPAAAVIAAKIRN